MALTKQGQEILEAQAKKLVLDVPKEKVVFNVSEKGAVAVQDWYIEEMPHVDLSDEAVAEHLGDVQDWITEEYGTIALLDEIMEDFELLRATTKTRIDVITKLARSVERLQKEIEG